MKLLCLKNVNYWKIPLKGHKVSHANNKTKRRFLPNLKKVKFKSEILNKKS